MIITLFGMLGIPAQNKNKTYLYKVLTTPHTMTPFEKTWSVITFFLSTTALLIVISISYTPVRISLISPLSEFIARYTTPQKTTELKTLTLTNGKTVALPDLRGLFTDNLRFSRYIQEQADGFMGLLPDSEKRVVKELAMLTYLEEQQASAADIILGSQAVVTKPGRAWAMDYLWKLRQEGALVNYNIFPLDEVKIAWAESQNIDPRMLAIATDIYGSTLHLIQAKPELFFEASQSKARENNIEKYIPNPAVIAKLQMMETGWRAENIIRDAEKLGFAWDFSRVGKTRAFVNIGSETAWEALNLSDSWFPSGHDDLLWIASILEKDSGLPYLKHVKKIPGSLRGSGDGSGGAIGPQFMPINARLFMSWYEEANKKLGNSLPAANLFNPWTGTILTYLYLSSEFYHRQMDVDNVTHVVRPGYAVLSSNDANLAFTRKDPRIRALRKWNPLDWEATSAVKAGEEYYDLWVTTEVSLNMQENNKKIN